MTGVHGQASVEYAGLLALAAVLGAALALIAGPPLVHAVRNALVAVLSGPAHAPGPRIASAADVADVQSALLPAERSVTPDAALIALGRRLGEERAEEIADALLLVAARGAVPWIGEQHAYRAWSRLADGPYEAASTADGDRDVETPTGAPVVVWITVAAQHRALATALAHHTDPTAVALDAVTAIPVVGGLARSARGVGRTTRVARGIADTAQTGSDVVDLITAHDGDVPPGMRAGDVVVAWPVHRTFWRDGREDHTPLVDLGSGFGLQSPAHDYYHVVYLRPGDRGLESIAEGFAA
jgi:hypothetical protein